MKLMKFLSVALVLFGFLLSAPAGALAARTGIVDVNKVYTDSKAAKEADVHLAKVSAVLQRGMLELEKRMEKAPKEEREREIAAGARVLERQMQIEVQAARQVVHEAMMEAVREWRKAKGGVVLARQQVLDYSPKLDITDTVIASMNKKTVKFGDLPVVSFKDDKKADKKSEKK